jgi:riboflavin biosynthesis pyrimidine reductase
VILHRLYPASATSIDYDDRDELLRLYSPVHQPWVRINMIQSVTGSAVGVDGTSESLSNAVDRRILGVIRELADVVLIGAESARTEGYVRPRRARLAVVTNSGNLAGHRIEGSPPPLVLCPASAVDSVNATCAAAEIMIVADPITPASMVAALAQHGLHSIVVEGGPTLSAQFVDAEIANELCLTTAPVVAGPVLPVLGTADLPSKDATLTQLLRDESGFLYARWLLSPA